MDVVDGKVFFSSCQMISSPVDESRAALKHIRGLVAGLEKSPEDAKSQENVIQIRGALINLRRCHSKLRTWQNDQHMEALDAVKKLRCAKCESENSAFIRSQCDMLVNKYNTSQSPELQKLLPSLPSIEAYSERHKMDDGFVSYESDPHQFMLNMLSDELVDRKHMEEEVIQLNEKRAGIEKEIVEKKKFLESIGSRLADLARSVDTIKDAFGMPREAVETCDSTN